MPRVLVIDDDVQTCQTIATALRERGNEVDLAHDGLEGLERFRASLFDLVVCDLFLPGMMGYDVCSYIKASDRRVPIIAMSGICRSIRDAEELGVPVPGDDFVAKPIDLAALQRQVERLLHAPAKALAAVPNPFGDGVAPPAAEDAKEQWVAGLAAQVVDIFLSRRSGLLHLARGQLTVDVSFQKGFPSDVAVPFRRENVGLFLLQQGRLTEAQYDSALKRMVERRVALEKALEDLNLVQAGEFPAVLRAHKREALVSCFGWGSGQLDFREAAPQGEPAFRLNPSTLVIEGVGRAYPKSSLERLFKARIDHVAHPGPRFEDCLKVFAPIVYRSGMHSHLAGEWTVEELTRRSGDDPLPLWRLLRTFEVLKIVEIAAPTAAAAAPSPPPAPVEESSGGEPPAPPAPAEPEAAQIATDARALWRELMALKDADHYAVLGVTPDAKAHQIRDAFLDRVGRYRPDREELPADVRRLAGEMLLRLAAAYGALSDPGIRETYDRRRAAARAEASATAPTATPIEATAPPPEPPAPAEGVTPVEGPAGRKADVLFSQGKAALERLDFPAALRAFEEARRLSPEVAEFHLFAGLARYHSNSHDPETIQIAVQEMLRAVEIDPENDLSYYHIGQIYREQGLLNKARQMFTRAARINPNNVLAQRALEALGGMAAA
jgi:CheY-like chemotaxis protein